MSETDHIPGADVTKPPGTREFTPRAVIAGMLVGLLSAVVLIVLSPAVMGVDAASVAARHLIQRPPIFPLDNPAIVSVPLGFLAAVVGTLIGRDAEAEASSTSAPRPGSGRSDEDGALSGWTEVATR